MAQELMAFFLNIHIEGVPLLHVPVIDPGRNHSKAPQLPAVLVRDEIVRIVSAQADPRKGTFGLSLENLAGQHAIRAIWTACGFLEHFVQVLAIEGALRLSLSKLHSLLDFK